MTNRCTKLRIQAPVNQSNLSNRLCSLLADNRDKSGLALDGDLKNENTNLASSTIVPPNSSREALGIVVQYKVKIRLVLGFGLSNVCIELPFILTHPNAADSAIPSGSGGLDGGGGLEDNGLLDDFHFTEAGRAGDDSSGGEGAGGGGGDIGCLAAAATTNALPLPAPASSSAASTAAASASPSALPTVVAVHAQSTNGGATANPTRPPPPQMGVLAKRTGAQARKPSPPHIAEFLRASEMPDGMVAFVAESPAPTSTPRGVGTPKPAAASTAKEAAVDALESFLGLTHTPPQRASCSSNGHTNGQCVVEFGAQALAAAAAASASASLPMCSEMASSCMQLGSPPLNHMGGPTVTPKSSTATGTTNQEMDADDLIFEDFARLRLHQQQLQKQQQQQLPLVS